MCRIGAFQSGTGGSEGALGCEPGAESALTAVIPRAYDRTGLVSDSNARSGCTESVRFWLVPVRSTSVRSVPVRTVLEHPPQGGVPFPNTRGRGGYTPHIDFTPFPSDPSKLFDRPSRWGMWSNPPQIDFTPLSDVPSKTF